MALFTFTNLRNRLQGEAGEPAYVLIAWILLLVAYHGIYGAYFPTPLGTIGHDFGLCLAGTVDGFIWFAKNGPWEVPWFTPGFCGGQPYFADPQSGYYSVPQWLSFVMDPLTANYLTLLFFASAGYFGTYLLARRSFGLPIPWAILAAGLFFFNGFLPLRTLIGETGFHGLSLAPWLALALLTPAARRVSSIGLAILAGTIAAYWLQSGLTTLMVPAALSVALVLLAYRLRQPWPRDLLARMLIAIGISVLFSASKLVASLAFYSRFERTQYLLPGFNDPWALLQTNLLALFGSSEGAYRIALPALLNAQWTAFPHEWAYGFTPVPILVILVGLLLGRLVHPRPPENPSNSAGKVGGVGVVVKIFVGLGLGLISLAPLVLQIYTPEFNAHLKSLPLIGATAWPMRWLILYLPVLPIATAWLAWRALGERQAWAPWVVFGALLLLVGFNLMERRQYYYDQNYNPEQLLAGYARLAAGEVRDHRVKAIGLMIDPDTGNVIADGRRNDIVVDGISQARCYNPSFGYRLEKLPANNLVLGDVLWEREGSFNIRNPACYVFPEENACRPGDKFRLDQRAEAEAFVAYRPFPFKKSQLQRVADRVTMGSLVLAALFVLLVWPWLVRRSADSI